MPSDHEIKQLMTEKGFPFFEGGGLKDIHDRLEALEKRSKAKKPASVVTEEAGEPSQKAVAKSKAEREKAKKARRNKARQAKRQQDKAKVDEEKSQDKEPDVKATVNLDDSGKEDEAQEKDAEDNEAPKTG